MFCFAVFQLLSTDKLVRLLFCLRNIVILFLLLFLIYFWGVCHIVFTQYSFHHLCVAIRNTRGYHFSWDMEIFAIIRKTMCTKMFIIIPLPRNRTSLACFLFVFCILYANGLLCHVWLHSLYLHRLPCSQPTAKVGVIAFDQSISELIILTKIITSLVIRKEIVYWLHKGIRYITTSKYQTKNGSSSAKYTDRSRVWSLKMYFVQTSFR